MDYSGYRNFPFPENLTAEGEDVRSFFMSLPDGEQLSLLNQSHSYDEFYSFVLHAMRQSRS